MRKLRLLMGCALLMGYLGAASAQWRENDRLIEDTAWRKGWGTFGAMLHLTDKPDELFATWNKPGAGVPVSTSEYATRGKPIVGVVIFSGCTPNAMGQCDSNVYFQVFKPDGSPYGAEESAELWSGKPPPLKAELQLSVGAIGVQIEPKDPSGKYLVRARLVDNVSHAQVELNRTFQVAP